MTPAITTAFFALGLVIGSFLNVVIYRFRAGRTLGGRSICVSCRKQLRFFELIPLLSFLAQLGRCRSCKSKISRMYPAVEFITGAIFALLSLKLEPILSFGTLHFVSAYIFYALAFSILVVIAFYHLRHKIIPDSLSLSLGILAFLGLFLLGPSGFQVRLPALGQVFSGIFAGAFFASFWLLSRGKWMGLGDAKLAVGLGWLLGGAQMISAVILSFWTGAVFGIFLVLFKKYGMKSEVPFAPFLVLGAVLAFLFELHVFPTL